MSAHVATLSDFSTREPFKSVGLVCACGHAVAGIEGVLSPCSRCGAVYVVSVSVISRAGHSQKEPT